MKLYVDYKINQVIETDGNNNHQQVGTQLTGLNRFIETDQRDATAYCFLPKRGKALVSTKEYGIIPIDTFNSIVDSGVEPTMTKRTHPGNHPDAIN